MRSSRSHAVVAVGLAALAPFLMPSAVRSEVAKKKPNPAGSYRVASDVVLVGAQRVTARGDLFPGRAIETRKGGVAHFNLKLKGSECRLRKKGRIIVRPAPGVLLRVTSTAGEVWCVTLVAAGSASFEGRQTRVFTRDPVVGLVVTKKRTVVKVRRGAVVVTGASGRRRGVVVLARQQTVVRTGGDPARPAPVVLTQDQKTVANTLAAMLPRPKDTTAPAVELAETPPAVSEDVLASFSFAASEKDVVFECAFDGIDFRVCSTPATRTLKPGRHAFHVRAVDAAGNRGETTTYEWTIAPPSAIVFESDRGGGYEIYVIGADGRGEVRLTNQSGADVDPAWSPTRAMLAFESARDNNLTSEIYVMNADGSGQRRLTFEPAPDRNPKWAPEGERIAFESQRDGNAEIYVMNADGTQQERLTVNKASDSEPAWSPDGRRIVFESDRDGNSELYVMNADGSGQTRLTSTPAGEFNPAWSPDGKSIAFSTNRHGNHELYVMNADGSRQTRLTRNEFYDADPAWSPLGTRLAFTSNRRGNLDIFVMNADGTDQTRVTTSGGDDLVPDW